MDFSIFHEFDYGIFTFFGEQIHSTVMNIVAEFFTFFGGSEFIIPMAVVGAIMIPFKKTRKVGMSVLFAVIIGTIITNLIAKPLFDRPRPYLYYAADESYMNWYTFTGMHVESDKSFPSGHTTGAFEIALALFLTLNKKYSWVFPTFAVFVGLSRIYLMVHYPTDVIGGFFIGVFAGIMGWLITKAILKKTEGTKFDNFDLAKIKKA